MRTIVRGLWLLGGAGIAWSGIVSCSASCDDKDSCGTYVPPGGGAGGTSGTSGTTSEAGEAGESNNAGTANGGSSGAAGGGSTNGGAAGEGGALSESGASGESGVPCDSNKSPSEESCVVNSAYAIFVAPTGTDTAAGTKDAPVKTITKAVELAGDAKIVIACDGTYNEQLTLTGRAKLYGGFVCPGAADAWTYEAGKKATVAPSARGFALGISSGASTVVMEDFELDAKNGVAAGESSIAAFVNASTDVTLNRVKLAAGKGVDGANGTLTPVTFPLQSTLNGNPASGDAGGAKKTCMCPVGGSTAGGRGGDGGALGATGGGLGTPALGGGPGGTIGAGCGAFPSGTGGDGTNATSLAPASGATKLGSISPTGWLGAPGIDGAPGTPGQGGGGGTGADTGGGGGGGGCGGCGGAGASGGKAGGSSIALLVLNSTVTLNAGELSANGAGKGGSAIAGQNGQTTVGGGGTRSGLACNGGNGGTGGKGGAGGGAAGGISVGVAYTGTLPSADSATTITTGVLGTKGIGGVPGVNDGIDGKAQSLLEIP